MLKDFLRVHMASVVKKETHNCTIADFRNNLTGPLSLSVTLRPKIIEQFSVALVNGGDGAQTQASGFFLEYFSTLFLKL